MKRATKKIKKVIECFLYLISYVITFFIIQYCFNIAIINSDNKSLYILLTAVIIFILNKTVAKVALDLTIPFVAMSYGIFYFIVCTAMIKITDLILYTKVDFVSVWKIFLVTFLIAGINFIIEVLIVKPISRRFKL